MTIFSVVSILLVIDSITSKIIFFWFFREKYRNFERNIPGMANTTSSILRLIVCSAEFFNFFHIQFCFSINFFEIFIPKFVSMKILLILSWWIFEYSYRFQNLRGNFFRSEIFRTCAGLYGDDRVVILIGWQLMTCQCQDDMCQVCTYLEWVEWQVIITSNIFHPEFIQFSLKNSHYCFRKIQKISKCYFNIPIWNSI